MKSAQIKERELIIKLHKEGKKQQVIASILGFSQQKVSFWIRRYNLTGKLTNNPRSGRPTKLKKKCLNNIKEAVRHIIISNKNKAGVSSKQVKGIIEKEAGREYSLRHIQRILHKIGLSLITPRVSHIKKDKKDIEKFRKEFKKNSNRNIWVIRS